MISLSHQATSKRSWFITLVHAAMTSFANFSLESEHAWTSARARNCECERKSNPVAACDRARVSPKWSRLPLQPPPFLAS